MPVEFGTAKTVFILAIVVGCFAVLWPKLFYPMLQSSISNRTPPDQSQVCCDVIFETDINAIKIMMEMCGNILHHHSELDPKINAAFLQGKWSKEMVNTCRSDVLEKCGVDITAFLNEKVRLGHSYKQMLDGIRSFNISVCLKTNFGVPPSLIGAPRRMRILSAPRHIRQERPPHLRPDLLHPALRERGRAIPQSHIVPRIVEKEGRPGPIPGMRPPMGGAGHVVPAPKTSGTMGIIMPMYTIGIVIFFMYTIMRVMFKKPSDSSSSYGEFHPDPEFRKIVFAEDYNAKSSNCEDNLRPRIKNDPPPAWKTSEENGTRLVMTAITGLIAEVDLQREILEKRAGTQNSSLSEKKTEEEIPEVNSVAASTYSKNKKPLLTSDKSDVPQDSLKRSAQEEIQEHKTEENTDIYHSTKAVEPVSCEPQEATEAKPKQKVEFYTGTEGQSQQLQQQGQVVVVGMDVTASCEGGGRWSRPGTPVPPPDLGVLPATVSRSRSATPAPSVETETRSIMLEGPLPSHSQLLVSDSETHAEPTGVPGNADADPPVVLSGKVTLSLISLQEALAAEEEQEQQKQSEPHQQEQQEQPNKDDTVRAVRVNVIETEDDDDEEEVEDEEEEEEEEEDEEEEEEEVVEEGKDDNRTEEVAVQETVDQVLSAENEQQRDQIGTEISAQELVNDAHPGGDETPTTTNYTTASGAAEATSTSGTEETAADMSALESFGVYDEQQGDEQDVVENQGDIWNGDVHSEEEEDEEESEDEAELHRQPNAQ